MRMIGHNLTVENFTSSYNYEMPMCVRVLYQVFMSSIYLDFIYDALGIPLNAWILVAIFTSTELRVRMRNKIMACICAQGLFDCLVLLTLSMYNYFDRLHYFSRCHTHRAHYVMWFFSEFVSNWNLVTLLGLVIFTSVTLRSWNRLNTQVVTYCLLLWPWLFSAITVIPTVLSNYKEYVFTRENATLCLTSMANARRALYALDIGVPACVAAFLLAAIIFLNRKRARDISNRRDLSRQLIGDSSDSEPIVPYIAIVAIIFVCDFGALLRFVYIQWRSFSTADCAVVVMRTIVEILEGAKDVLLPLVFLLFPEVRSQAKKLLLRFCSRRRAADVTVAYVKDI